MTHEDMLVDQRIHDAYERIELSDEAQERMLSGLLAAQAQRERVDEARVTESPRRRKAPVIRFVPRRVSWQVWLSAAAALVVALVVVRLGTGSTGDRATVEMTMTESSAESASAKGTSDKAASNGVSYDLDAADEETAAEESDAIALDGGAAAGESDSADAPATGLVMDEAPYAPSETNGAEKDAADAVTSDELESVDLYPRIRLEDGTYLTALEEGMHTVPLSADEVGELVGEARASSFDAPDGDAEIPCEVYTLADDTAAYAVRYEGEDSYWLCTPLK